MKEYIEREAVIQLIKTDGHDGDYNLGATADNEWFCAEVKRIPAADVVEVRHSRWVRPLSPYAWYKCSCELCGYEAPDSGWTAEAWEMDWYEEQIKKFVEAHPFCTKCGAKMDGGVDDA